jgi:hypothetical protein
MQMTNKSNLDEEILNMMEIYSKIELEKSCADEKLLTIKKRLLNGEFTDYPIRDFSIVYHNSLSSKVQEPYILFSEKLRENIGGPVLVVKNTKRNIIYHNSDVSQFIDPDIHNFNTDYSLGIISLAPNFDIISGNVIVNTANSTHLEYPGGIRSNFWTQKNDNISLHYSLFKNLTKDDVVKNKPVFISDLATGFTSSTQILMGKEVDSYFGTNEWLNKFYHDGLNSLYK